MFHGEQTRKWSASEWTKKLASENLSYGWNGDPRLWNELYSYHSHECDCVTACMRLGSFEFKRTMQKPVSGQLSCTCILNWSISFRTVRHANSTSRFDDKDECNTINRHSALIDGIDPPRCAANMRRNRARQFYRTNVNRIDRFKLRALKKHRTYTDQQCEYEKWAIHVARKSGQKR